MALTAAVASSRASRGARSSAPFDYDGSGNRTNRRFGAYDTDDDDAYTYVSGPTDIISSVSYSGSSLVMYYSFKGEITQVKMPNTIQFVYDEDGRVTSTNDAYLGEVDHLYSYFGDRYKKVSPCNTRATRFFYRPDTEVGASPYVNLIDLYDECESEYPRHHRAFIYLDGRPIAVAHADQASSGAAPSDQGLFWLHTDHLGTPVLVTNSSRVERWRWENDPFGRAEPVEYTVSSQDVSPDEDSSGASDVSGLVWSEDFAPSSATAVRVHFLDFDVNAGTTRTGKDYVQILDSSNMVVQTLTGDLGAFWGPWVSGSTAKVRLYGDAVADGTGVVVVDQLEYTTATNGRFVMHLRMPGQIWDEEVRHAYNYQRWYRAGDGRYLSADPVGLLGGESGYYAYGGGNPNVFIDPTGTTCQPGYSEVAPSDPLWAGGQWCRDLGASYCQAYRVHYVCTELNCYTVCDAATLACHEACRQPPLPPPFFRTPIRVVEHRLCRDLCRPLERTCFRECRFRSR